MTLRTAGLRLVGIRMPLFPCHPHPVDVGMMDKKYRIVRRRVERHGSADRILPDAANPKMHEVMHPARPDRIGLAAVRSHPAEGTVVGIVTAAPAFEIIPEALIRVAPVTPGRNIVIRASKEVIDIGS